MKASLGYITLLTGLAALSHMACTLADNVRILSPSPETQVPVNGNLNVTYAVDFGGLSTLRNITVTITHPGQSEPISTLFQDQHRDLPWTKTVSWKVPDTMSPGHYEARVFGVRSFGRPIEFDTMTRTASFQVTPETQALGHQMKGVLSSAWLSLTDFF
ncbi:MAG: hypothetical protein DHS80DRAFT_23558 [Piptocephalis tieghemiana]|nr:MAG: hypothetical protein DHS80DRAFT_23558 [Piptocephalis tieghemiana]